MTMESVHTQRFQVELCRLGRNGAPRAQHAASSRQTAQRRTTSSIERARPRHHHARGHARASSPPVCVSVRPHLRVRFLAMLPCEEGTPPSPIGSVQLSSDTLSQFAQANTRQPRGTTHNGCSPTHTRTKLWPRRQGGSRG